MGRCCRCVTVHLQHARHHASTITGCREGYTFDSTVEGQCADTTKGPKLPATS
jgi:hypothetical protein